MPPIGERIAVLETDVKVVKANVAETKGDVKLLLKWRDEERGARESDRIYREALAARLATRYKAFGILLTILTIGLNLLFRVI